MEFQEIIEIDPNQRTEDVRTQGTFESLMISPSTVANLKNHGYRVPSPVQMKAIPTGLTGLDMLVQAKSGTGKTLVFAILAIENLNLQSNDVQKIIIAPTREIATQIKDTIKTIAHFKTRIALLVGGTPVHLDVQALKRGAHIVVGTTGRICQMAQSGALNMKAIDLFVLDEADKLMEECFQKDINYLFSALPPSRQVAVFSATYPRNLDKLLAKFMRDASLVRLNSEDVQLIGIKQYIAVSDQPAINCLVHLLKSIQFNQCLVFCNLHQQCEPTCSRLENDGFLAAFISAQMTQPERDSVIEKLKHNKLKVLVSTDLYFLFFLTARGIDASNVNLVVNLETAINLETYFHRIGRAARFGGYGAAITILADSREVGRFKAMTWRDAVNVRVLDLERIPSDLTTNLSYFNSCLPPSGSAREHGLQNGMSKSASPPVLQFSSAPHGDGTTVNTLSDSGSYDRQTFLDLSKNALPLSKDMQSKLKRLGIYKNLPDNSNSNCFIKEVAELSAKILKSKNAGVNETVLSSSSVPNEQPKKYKFVPLRQKAKRKFYMRGELISIRDSVSKDIWKKYALSRFDMSGEPFLAIEKECESSDRESAVANESASPQASVVAKKERTAVSENDVKRYSRKDLIAIQNSVPKKSWIPYVKARWDTTQEPFQLNQYLRCSFEEQLRRQRQIEKKQRAEVMKERQRAQMERPKLLASARTPCRTPVLESSFEMFCSRVEEDFKKFKEEKRSSWSNIGAVVPLRDPTEVWQAKVNYHTSWLRNFDDTFNYDVRKGAGLVQEVAIETNFGRSQHGQLASELEEKPEDGSNGHENKDDETNEQENKAEMTAVKHQGEGKCPSSPGSVNCEERETETRIVRDDLVGDMTSSTVSSSEEEDAISTSEQECAATGETASEVELSEGGTGSADEDSFDEEEEQLRQFAEAYRKNVDFHIVFSSYLWMLRRRYH
uniref:RNA helicase n=1 Tax=Haemonchus contortus TaxID=6289 RepID=A0A7I4YGR7_HAECO